MLRILFTGGDTGGHIYPILAVAEELRIFAKKRTLDVDLRYLGAAGPYRGLLEKNGINVSGIFPAKLRRYFSLMNLIDVLLVFPLSVVQAFWKIFWLMPDVLFSKGGTASFPVVLASKFYRVPIIIHDSDAVPGFSTRLAAKWADRIEISFASVQEHLLESVKSEKEIRELSRKIALVGNPVRRSLVSDDLLEQKAAKEIFGFKPDLPLIVIIGGSQGAVKINEFMAEIAEELVKKYQIFHQTGARNFNGTKTEINFVLKNLSEEEKSRYKTAPYFEDDLKNVYAAADLIVSRASGGAIFESAVFGKPSILIPLPSEVVGEHQIANAYEYSKSGAAFVIEQENLKPHIFLNELDGLFSQPDKLRAMAEAAQKFSKPQAGQTIADRILAFAERR